MDTSFKIVMGPAFMKMYIFHIMFVKSLGFLLCYSMNYRDFSVKSKLIISLFQTVKLSLKISLFEK